MEVIRHHYDGIDRQPAAAPREVGPFPQDQPT
jgi:hypothetical protein